MSITPYLDGLEVDPETKRVLGAALEMTRLSLVARFNQFERIW
jgi:hypothetical protein